MADHQSLIDLIRSKLENRRIELNDQLEGYPVAGTRRDPGFRHILKQQDSVTKQLNELAAVERISGGDLSNNNVAVANFIVSLTTLSELDRLEIATRASEL